MKLSLDFLEVMVMRTCNLSCNGCTTFSDLTYKGFTSWDTGKSWIEPWLDRIDIKAIGVMGGEPLINPEIRQWITGIRELLPNAQIRFVTNGLLLEKNWDIVSLLDKVGNSVLKISYHVNNPLLDNTIERIFNSYNWEPITEFGIDRYKNQNGTRFQIAKPTKFLKTFRNDYNNMMPHNNNPADAFDICVQQRCPLLYKGKIYKCGTLGLTPELIERMGNPNYEQWEKFIDSGLNTSCNEKDLDLFLKNFGKPHRFCAQCPSVVDNASIVDHLSTVEYKSNFHNHQNI